jgi:acetylornithine/succinyldiaminopimelate/putrescine aminotransferase
MLAMAAVLATLDAIEQDGMIENARRVENHLRDSLANVTGIAAIHGKGCLLGIEFADKCSPIHARLLEKKIITGTSSDPKVLRLLPPLCVSIEDVDIFIEELSQTSTSVSNAA